MTNLDPRLTKDLTPEHTKRWSDHAPIHRDVLSAMNYVESVMWSADAHVGAAPMWYGWALREAFLAGISHGQKE